VLRREVAGGGKARARAEAAVEDRFTQRVVEPADAGRPRRARGVRGGRGGSISGSDDVSFAMELVQE
jgi:hypothetical protein